MSLHEKKLELENLVIAELKTIFDPEIPVNIYDLGLIYEIGIDDEMNVSVQMTLTSPNCPVAESLPAEVNEKLRAIKESNEVTVEVVFDPPWSRDMMSEAALLDLGFL